ncbi:SH3 domain-containing protein [Loktanella sp. DJP18]|uniref:SH3 domain-containing protein n=1 Tax=Loktanella sp. DJP18 TaxID=3409788 RepID=UPI003BB608E7
MRPFITTALTAILLAGCAGPQSVAGRYEVRGVEDDDMLKLRAGPGTGYIAVLGLPNGTEVYVEDCEPNGNTPWCRLTLDDGQGVTGYASKAYLHKL